MNFFMSDCVSFLYARAMLLIYGPPELEVWLGQAEGRDALMMGAEPEAAPKSLHISN